MLNCEKKIQRKLETQVCIQSSCTVSRRHSFSGSGRGSFIFPPTCSFTSLPRIKASSRTAFGGGLSSPDGGAEPTPTPTTQPKGVLLARQLLS